MKILIVQDYLRIGGTERQTLFLASYFRQCGDEVELLIFRPGGHLAGSAAASGLSIRTLQGRDSRISLWAPGLMRAVAQAQPDIILCMGRTANCYAGFIQLRFPQIPVVGTLRTGKVLFPLHHWSMGVIRAVVANSNWWKRQLIRRGFPAERIHVVHNAVLLNRSEAERKELRASTRAAFAIAPETCIFLNVATFRPGKRHRELLRICADIRAGDPDLDWRLWLVGDGKEYRRCKELAAQLGLGTRVRFFHFQADPFPFYAAADVAVSASIEESLPNFLVEAQATGLPLAAYDCRGVKETCLPGKTGVIVPAGDQQRLREAMQAFARSPGLRQSFAERAPAFAQRRFSAEPQAAAMRAFLLRCAGCPNP